MRCDQWRAVYGALGKPKPLRSSLPAPEPYPWSSLPAPEPYPWSAHPILQTSPTFRHLPPPLNRELVRARRRASWASSLCPPLGALAASRAPKMMRQAARVAAGATPRRRLCRSNTCDWEPLSKTFQHVRLGTVIKDGYYLLNNLSGNSSEVGRDTCDALTQGATQTWHVSCSQAGQCRWHGAGT